jgi:hypothetical protein
MHRQATFDPCHMHRGSRLATGPDNPNLPAEPLHGIVQPQQRLKAGRVDAVQVPKVENQPSPRLEALFTPTPDDIDVRGKQFPFK